MRQECRAGLCPSETDKNHHFGGFYFCPVGREPSVRNKRQFICHASLALARNETERYAKVAARTLVRRRHMQKNNVIASAAWQSSKLMSRHRRTYSSPRRRSGSIAAQQWMPACAGMTSKKYKHHEQNKRPPPRYAVLLHGITHEIYQFRGARWRRTCCVLETCHSCVGRNRD